MVFGRERTNFLHSGFHGAGFVLESVLTSQGCFEQCLHRAKAFSDSPITTEWTAVQKSWEGIQPGQLTAAGHRDISDHVASWSVHKTGGRTKKGCLELRCLSSQVTTVPDTVLLSWKWLNIQLPLGCFAFLV